MSNQIHPEGMLIYFGMVAVCAFLLVAGITIVEEIKLRRRRAARERGELVEPEPQPMSDTELMEALALEVLKRTRPRSRF